MAAKKAKLDYTMMLLCAIISIALGVAFMVLRGSCMSKRKQFVDEYCLDDRLEDYWVRFIASVIVNVAVLLLGWALKTAICAVRTHALHKGLSEGIYVAIGGLSRRYQAAALYRREVAARWRMAVVLILLSSLGVQVFQPVLNYIQSPEILYLKTDNNATVFGATSYYNVTTPDSSGSHVQVSFLNGFNMVAKLAEYSLGANSISPAEGHVSTNVLRTGFISQKDLKGATDSALVLTGSDTVANVDSRCFGSLNYSTPLATLLSSQPSTSTGVSFEAGQMSGDALVGYVYDITFSTVKQDYFVVATRIQSFSCYGCNSQKTVQVLERLCNSTITIKKGSFLMNVASQNLTMLGNNQENSTVPPELFSAVVANYTKSIEGLQDLQGQVGTEYNQAVVGYLMSTFPTGLFKTANDNYLHSRLCSSVAYTLNYLWGTYGSSFDNNTFVPGNDFSAYDVQRPLYRPDIRIYMTSASAWILVSFLAGPTVLLCIVGAIFTALAKINIKGSQENALLDNMTSDDLRVRRSQLIDFRDGFNARPAQASNDDDEQLELAFATTLYCRAHPLSQPLIPLGQANQHGWQPGVPQGASMHGGPTAPMFGPDQIVRLVNVPHRDPVDPHLAPISQRCNYC